MDTHRSPEAMARCLVSYIPCDKRVRSEVYVAFGSSPGLDTIREIRRAATAFKARLRKQSDNLGVHPEDHIDFRVGTFAKPARGRPCMRPVEETVEEETPQRPFIAPIFPKDIIAGIASEFGLTADQITGPRRQAKLMNARRTVCYVLQRRGNSFPRIASWLNFDCHSSVIHHSRTFEERATAGMWEVANRYIAGAA